MLKKTYILTVIGGGKYGKIGVEIALDDIAHAVEIMSVLCDYATNPLDFMIQAVVPDMAELSDEGMTEGELNKALAETYDNIKCD